MSKKTQLLDQVKAQDETAYEDMVATKATAKVIEAWLAANPAKVKRTMGDTLKRYREMEDHYQTSISHTGRKSLSIGDDVALFLEGMSPTEVLQAAERILGCDDGELVARYAHLNLGQQRMNGGNRIRAALKRGDITTNDLH